MTNNSVSQKSRTRRLAVFFLAFPLSLAASATAHTQTLTTLQSFNGTNGAFPSTSVVKARHRLVQHSNGNYYGVTPLGGTNDDGVVYELTPGGVETVVYNFCSLAGCADGAEPAGALALGVDGNLYGTTFVGGANNLGTVFKISTSGSLTTLYSFGSKANSADGANPFGALVQGSDGNFYGTTFAGGNSTGDGTVFKITSGGSLTTIHSFSGSDGANPEGDLVQSGWNSQFYGLTFAGGNSNNAGTAFEINSTGSLTTLYVFCSLRNCNDGNYPQAPLTPDAFGNFYGTTELSGANTYGTLFQINTSGQVHTLYHFCAKTNCTDGAEPSGGPVVGIDGNVYGTTALGGASNNGSVYQFTPWGVLYTLYNFCSKANCADGQNPESPLVQGTDQNFYGTTVLGGAYGEGTAFNLSTIPPSGFGCNGTYSGVYWGNITVSKGQSCVWTDGGQIYGNIYLTGGSLNLNNASVFGNVQVEGGTYSLGPSLSIWSNLTVQNIAAGSAQNTICGVNVNGDFQFLSNGTSVEIGQSSGACPGNTVGGNLQLNNNTGTVQVFNNSGSNSIQCTGNSSITGAGNSAQSKQGQCSSF